MLPPVIPMSWALAIAAKRFRDAVAGRGDSRASNPARENAPTQSDASDAGGWAQEVHPPASFATLSASINERFKALPPEQRVLMEKLVKPVGPQNVGASLKETGKTAKIAGYECAEYLIVSGGKVLREYWVSSLLRNEVLKEIDPDSLERFAQAMECLLKGNPFMPGVAKDQMIELSRQVAQKGVVLKSVYHMDVMGTEMTVTTTVVSVRHQRIPASEFKVPEGYKRVEVFM